MTKATPLVTVVGIMLVVLFVACYWAAYRPAAAPERVYIPMSPRTELSDRAELNLVRLEATNLLRVRMLAQQKDCACEHDEPQGDEPYTVQSVAATPSAKPYFDPLARHYVK